MSQINCNDFNEGSPLAKTSQSQDQFFDFIKLLPDSELFVSNCLKPSSITLSPDTDIYQALQLMTEEKCEVMAVLDAHNHYLGVLEKVKILEVFEMVEYTHSSSREWIDQLMSIERWVNSEVLLASKDHSILEVSQIMKDLDVSWLPICDKVGKFISIVNNQDILNFLIKRHPFELS